MLTQMPQGFYGCRNRAGGFMRPFAHRGGIASGYVTSIFVGDPVKLMTTGVFELAAAGDAASGVFAGWQPEDANVFGQTFWRGGTTYVKSPEVFIWPIGPEYFYSVQGGGPILQTALGDSLDWVIGAGNANSGHSTTALGTSLAGAGASNGFKITNLRDEPGNAWGDLFTVVEGIFNEINLGLIPGNSI